MKRFFTPKPARSAADLREQAADAAQRVEALTAAVAGLEAQRGPTLIDGTPEDIRAASEALATARDDLSAAIAVRDTLTARAAQAETDELLAAFRADAAVVQAEAAALTAWCVDRLPALTAEIEDVRTREAALSARLGVLAIQQCDLVARVPDVLSIPLPALPLSAAVAGRHTDGFPLPPLRLPEFI